MCRAGKADHKATTAAQRPGSLLYSVSGESSTPSPPASKTLNNRFKSYPKSKSFVNLIYCGNCEESLLFFPHRVGD